METFRKTQREGLKSREGKILSEWDLIGVKKMLFHLSFGLAVARNYFPAVLLSRNDMKKGWESGESLE